MQLLVGRHVPWSLTSGQGQTGYCERKGRPLLGHLPPKLVTCNLAFSPIPGLSLGTWTGRACFIVLFVSNRDPRPCLAFWVVLFSWTVLFSWQLFHFTNLSLPFLLSTFKKSYFTLVVWFFFVCNLFTGNKKLQTLKADPHIQGASLGQQKPLLSGEQASTTCWEDCPPRGVQKLSSEMYLATFLICP